MAAFTPTLPFSTESTWSPDAAPLVSHVLLAEFDIDTGSTLRHAVPAPIDGYAGASGRCRVSRVGTLLTATPPHVTR